MANLLLDNPNVPAVGRQIEGLRQSAPEYSFGTSGRDAQFKTGLKHSPGPIYDPRGDEGKANMHVFSFGDAKQRPDYRSEVPISTTDLMGIVPDSQSFKFKGVHPPPFGTGTRFNNRDATIVKSHPAALYGQTSPGPAGYHPDILKIRRSIRASSFGLKTPVLGAIVQTPSAVGPGSYPLVSSVGHQAESGRQTLPIHSFPKDNRFGERAPQNDTFLDTGDPRSCLGRQVKSKNRTNPTFSFGHGTRDMRAKTALVGDSGEPKGHLRLEHPDLPVRREIMMFDGLKAE
ncbi:unnamed protein product [Vitrella brassicaformis CCMP3155]|uniref:Uncharacterized protein n=2 Tax=Vitrella brassicaformis TaxID=1169539 RepID=A0A0G4EGU6_VITBC|nr:unnamed protein product [Vitrella brassicaformis CCMP3155]|mmetsp:Transcript_13411/g.32018  ORF Transcript_13411/g.32018 Transcript_13411/m.32018 type:complete len:288 (+) Transcript_13411:145-1008(+)|eukprot:CEL94589.1 unnamed protein product [Vitrella brassicaformis CCMP3155]